MLLPYPVLFRGGAGGVGGAESTESFLFEQVVVELVKVSNAVLL